MSFEPLDKPDVKGMIQQTLGRPLRGGEFGVLLARAGVGKTACLTHIALEHLLQGSSVLHVCIDDIPDTVKIWYQELLRNITASRSLSPEESVRLQHHVEPRRFILAYLHHTFNPGKLEQSVRNLKEQANFHPDLVILDGLDFDRVSRSTLENLQEFAKRHEVSMWMSARTHRHIDTLNERGIPYPCHEIDDLFHAILLLEALPDAIQLKVLKRYDRYQPEHPAISLNPQTFLLMQE